MKKEDLNDLYTNALYLIPTNDISLAVGSNNADFDHLLTDYQSKTACLLTAANPYSQELSDEENSFRNMELKSEIDKKWKSLDAIASDKKAIKWKEESYLIFGIKLSEALRLAGTYGQHAILYYEKGKKVELIFTGAEIKSNDAWKDVLKSMM